MPPIVVDIEIEPADRRTVRRFRSKMGFVYTDYVQWTEADGFHCIMKDGTTQSISKMPMSMCERLLKEGTWVELPIPN